MYVNSESESEEVDELSETHNTESQTKADDAAKCRWKEEEDN